MRELHSTRLTDQVQEATRLWARKGGKKGRSEQVERMMAFAVFAESKGALTAAKLGPRTVVEFWKHLRAAGRSHATQMSYYYALRHLWALLELPGEVPPPRPEGGGENLRSAPNLT